MELSASEQLIGYEEGNIETEEAMPVMVNLEDVESKGEFASSVRDK